MTTDGLMPSDEFVLLAQELRDGRSVDEVYDIVVRHAVHLVDGCDRAAIGVLDGERFTTAAATDDVVRVIDRLQYELGEGPCLEASVEQRVQVDNDITVDTTWPRLSVKVVELTPVRAMLAVPLVHEGRRTGALDIFADRAGAFTEDSVSQAAVLASFASVALVGARQAELAGQLAEGMSTNREIGAAVGILMATHGISQEEAFGLLSQASQRLNKKLRDIAAGIVRNAPDDDS